MESAGPNWRVETQLTQLDWSDIVVADFSRPRWRLILRGLAAMFDFLFAGAFVNYLRANWRYALFFLYPLSLLGLFGAAGFIVARIAATIGLPWMSALGPLLGIACVVCLVYWLGRTTYLYYTLLGWGFAADVVYRRRPEFEVKLDQLARIFAKRVRDSDADEIVVFGHSLGSVIMILVVARALQQDQQPFRRDITINLVSAGSSLLKIGLHPAAKHFRAAVHKVVADPAIFWVEYQAIIDILGFFKTDPVAEMGLPACGKPIVRVTRIRNMVTETNYRRIRWNPLRLHLQFALANGRRYFYDFFMICCGPLSLYNRVQANRESVDAFAPDGTIRTSPSVAE